MWLEIKNRNMKQPIKSAVERIVHSLMFFGFDPSDLITSLRYSSRYLNQSREFKKYLRQSREFQKMGGRITRRFPILSDYEAEAGSVRGHYFHQDLLVASFVHAKNPKRHIDVGSRVDGFVAHVAAFRPIEILDIRPLTNSGHMNISFLRADLMSDRQVFPTADSVSCLHTIEHLGLGRYGDPIDPDGYKKGFKNLLKMVEPNGTLYISFPIGDENEVHFNSQRVFHPLDIFKWSDDKSIELKRFDCVDNKGELYQNVDPRRHCINMSGGCGIYSFTKLSNSQDS
jgi:hypothetical protein